MRYVLYGLGTLMLVAIIGFLFFLYSFDFRLDYEKLKVEFEELGLKPPAYRAFDVEGRKLSYLDTETSHDSVVVFIHGAPGSARDFKDFLKIPHLRSNHRLLVLERPGYGQYDYGEVEVSVRKQAEMLNAIIGSLPDSSKVFLVGHSYGGPVAMAMAALSGDDKVSGVLLVAALMSPKDEKMFWFNKPLDVPFVRRLLPTYIRMSNDEKMSHAAMLQDAEALWTAVDSPVLMIHGCKDWIAPPANVEYMDKVMSARQNYSSKMLPEKDHILQMNGVEDILEGIAYLKLESSGR